MVDSQAIKSKIQERVKDRHSEVIIQSLEYLNFLKFLTRIKWIKTSYEQNYDFINYHYQKYDEDGNLLPGEYYQTYLMEDPFPIHNVGGEEFIFIKE